MQCRSDSAVRSKPSEWINSSATPQLAPPPQRKLIIINRATWIMNPTKRNAMRILIVTQWFQPEPHFKGLDFAKALQQKGHEVEVLTGFPNYPGGQVYPGYQIRPFQREVIDGVPITRGYLYPSHNRSAIGRVANYISFAISTTTLALLLKKPDVVYVYTPPMTAALPAVILKFLRGVPFVPDIQDLWPDTLAATGMINNRRILRLIGGWTDLALRQAARIIVLSEGFRRRLIERGINTPITVIPNWAPPEIVDVAKNLLPPEPADTGPFTILFAGNMGKAQGLGIVIDAARILHARNSPIRFAMIGGGVEADLLKARAAEFRLNNIAFHAPRHPSQMGEIFAEADALLVHLRDDPLFAITIPSKTQAYLAIGKPILLGVRGDAANLVADAGAGIAFTPDDPDALVIAAEQIAALSPPDRHAMGEAGHHFYRNHLAFDIGVAAIEKELHAAARK